MTAICAVGSARQASGSNAGPHMAYRPAPYALRTITETLGTVASVTAVIILAPWRVMPSRSTAGPIMKPGASARDTSGALKAAHNQMNPGALSAESTNSTPPRGLGVFANRPTRSPARPPQPPEADDQLVGVEGLDLEEAAVVDQRVDDTVHVVGTALLRGDDVADTRRAGARVDAIDDRRGLPPAHRQVRQPPLGGIEGG